jgi:hypothetical protein
MSDSKYLGICIVVSSAILAGAIVFHARRYPAVAKSELPASESQIGRYQFEPSNPPGVIWVIDTTTGLVKTR